MTTENESSAGDPQGVDFPALVEAVKNQVLKSVAQALIGERPAQAQRPVPEADLPDGGMNFYDEVRRFEVRLITQALQQTEGKQTEAARLLGLKVTTLNSKMKQYQICRRRRWTCESPWLSGDEVTHVPLAPDGSCLLHGHAPGGERDLAGGGAA